MTVVREQWVSSTRRLALPVVANLLIGLLISIPVLLAAPVQDDAADRAQLSRTALYVTIVFLTFGVLQALWWLRALHVHYHLVDDVVRVVRGGHLKSEVPLSDVTDLTLSMGGTSLWRTLFGHGWNPPTLTVWLQDGSEVTLSPIMLNTRDAARCEAALWRTWRNRTG